MTPEQLARVEALFSQLSLLPRPQWESELDHLCPDDPEVRAEVLRLLRSDDAVTNVSEQLRGAAESALIEDRDPMLGTTVGPYTIKTTLGEGGFGVVYLAEQTRPIQRQVAFKVIKPGMGSRAVIARFEQERQALAIMDHPNVARVFDGGITPDGRPFFVMELVKGDPITKYADREQLTITQRIELFIPVCEAVQHAHNKGIIHRDLKPSNILVSPGDTASPAPRPKVIDFGVAKAISHTLTEKTIFTEQGQIIGTPEYMSPEQAEMGATDIDTRTDVYSLGVVLYELLTGLLPFDPESLRSAGYAEIQRIIREVDPPRPSTRLTAIGDSGIDIARRRHEQRDHLVSVLRRELEWIPLMAMRKNRGMRYRTASELADDLRNYLTGEPLIAGPESQWYKFRKALRKHRFLAASAAAIALTIIAGAAVSLAFAAREREQRKATVKALLERDVANAVKQASEAFSEQLIEAPDPEREGPDVRVVDVLDNAAANLSKRLDEQPGVRARLSAALGRAYINVGQPGKAIPLLTTAVSLFEADPTAALELRDARDRLGEAKWRHSSSPQEAITMLEAHIASLGSNPDDPALLSARNQLGGALKQAGRLEEAKSVYTDVFNRRTRVLGPSDSDTFITEYNLALIPLERGKALRAAGKTENAQAEFSVAVDLMRPLRDRAVRAFGETHPIVLPMTSELASLLNRLNRLDEAQAEYDRILDPMRRKFGARHWRTIQVVVNFALLKVKIGTSEQLREAITLMEEALLASRESQGTTSNDTIHITTKLAIALESIGEHDRCRWLLIRTYNDLKAAGADRAALSKQAKLIADYLERRSDPGATEWKAKVDGP